MSSAQAPAEAVQRLDSLYEFERAPVTEDKLEPGSYFAGLFAGEHVAATEFVIGALLVSFGAQRHGHRLRPAARQPPRRPVVDVRLRADRRRHAAHAVLVLAAHRRSRRHAPLQPLQRSPLLHPGRGDDHRLRLRGAPAVRHPRADRLGAPGPAVRRPRPLRGRRSRHARDPRLQAPRAVRGRLLAVDVRDVRRGGGRGAARRSPRCCRTGGSTASPTCGRSRT